MRICGEMSGRGAEPTRTNFLDHGQPGVNGNPPFGIEKDVRAVPVAELVPWIAWLQWHVRTRPTRPLPEPILKDFRTIEARDALVESSGQDVLTEDRGIPITRQGPRRILHPPGRSSACDGGRSPSLRER